ncbi:ATP-binding protein [Paraburkholderia phenazinium]|jgi:signal transduction histidine kinase|nr:ATP-binding protein [Paraburkholderia phenazinium]
MTNLPGSRARAQDRARRFSHTARTASIRYATVFGSIFAFTLLCVVSARANTRTEVNANPHVPSADLSHAAIAWCGLLALVLVLGALAVFALGGWCRASALLRRATEAARGAESEWQRRYEAVEAREQAARAVSEAQAAVVATQERDRIQTAMRHFVSGPLSALAGLLAALNGASLPLAHRPLAGRIESALRTCVRALEDMLAPSPVESRDIVLDESLTDLRELIDGVVALFSPAAAQKGLYLSVSIDRSIATRILADGARVGQILFHLVSRAVRATEHGQITIAARAERLNAGSQRIFISVRDVGANAARSTRAIQAQLPWPLDGGARVDGTHDENVSGLALCQRLARQMRGELTVGSEPGFGTCSTFSASFAIEHARQPMAPARADYVLSQQAVEPQPADTVADPSSESFDRSYLEALSNEGIDLQTFSRAWLQSIRDDLLQMRRLRDLDDVGGLRASLHRLSGAVGLVGARSLMEMLRRASVAQPKPEAGAIDALTKRIEALMMQLDRAIDPHRSNLS